MRRRWPRATRSDGHKLQIRAIVGSSALLLLIPREVRQRRLLERYALLWPSAPCRASRSRYWRVPGAVSEVIGSDPRNALFVKSRSGSGPAVCCSKFSIAVSRLADGRRLAQRVALLEERLKRPARRVRIGIR